MNVGLLKVANCKVRFIKILTVRVTHFQIVYIIVKYFLLLILEQSTENENSSRDVQETRKGHCRTRTASSKACG